MGIDTRTGSKLELDRLKEQTHERYKWSEPLRFNLDNEQDLDRLEELVESGEVRNVHDSIQLIADELFDIHYPEQKDDKDPVVYAEFTRSITEIGGDYGEWFFFPWSGDLARYPEEEDLRSLRSSRNRNLITKEEQEKLYESTVAVFGLSVGSNVVESLLYSGIGGKLIIGDMDIIEPSNLNRIRADFTEVGYSKVDHMAKKISTLDPYIEQVHLPSGLNPGNLVEVVEEHRPDLIVDEIDSIPEKVSIRNVAKKEKIPVLMATDVGDTSIIDIERHDTEDIDIFNGRIPEEALGSLLDGDLTREEMGQLVGKYFIGEEYLTPRLRQSLSEVGSTLPSWPQLGSTAALGGVGISYVARKMIIDNQFSSGREVIDLDDLNR